MSIPQETVHARAGQPARPEDLIDVPRLERAYRELSPDPAERSQTVAFGTSGHRGSPLERKFNEAHILAITQAICDYRRSHEITGPLYLGKDTHAASAPAEATAIEVLAANGVETVVQAPIAGRAFTPTPVISRAILVWNRGRTQGLADGIVITPSHNPPADGGFKYNPPNGGPADTEVTQWIEKRARALLEGGNREVRRRTPAPRSLPEGIRAVDLAAEYIEDLPSVVDLEAVRSAGLRLGVDPLGGASVDYWGRIAERHGLNLEIVNRGVDPTFGFMTLDRDGQIRMDCSSAYAMARLVQWRERFDVAFGSDPDADRHGIVTPSGGLLNPNHYLAVAIDYLLGQRSGWRPAAAVGKTVVSSTLIDWVVRARNRQLCEVPVGFKWFTPGLFDGTLCFGGEESAGASLLRRDGSTWVTDKDGIALGLLAAEMAAVTGRDLGELVQETRARLGPTVYRRIDTPLDPAWRTRFGRLSPDLVRETELAGDPIVAKLDRAPGNGAPLGGLKVMTAGGWFAVRLSGTEPVYKVYAESYRDPAHWESIVTEARRMVARVLEGV
ncbi:MAG TPA: phosphoglucomutase (alpha-D-glucose-1,6-bisphosphate-dependent) [Verrucomicrobiota bacterium]|nr:phosphoglucomutase (alpha-D-glucose-1,6-bisphosphate-dependent) [Verrucomicrobiota bacterium]HNU49891.1 phosphoglucomutase (alpha-D-glucose-1,6-bisphosphate-dependent) [Verrucomicrobiota bacterium]